MSRMFPKSVLVSAVLAFGIVGVSVAETKILEGLQTCVSMHVASIKDLGFDKPTTLNPVFKKIWQQDKCPEFRDKGDDLMQDLISLQIQGGKEQIAGTVTPAGGYPRNLYKTNTVVMYVSSTEFNLTKEQDIEKVARDKKRSCLDVGVYSVRELGFRKPVSGARVLARAKRKILRHCLSGGSRRTEYIVYPPVGPNELYNPDTVIGVSLINLYGGMSYLMAN